MLLMLLMKIYVIPSHDDDHCCYHYCCNCYCWQRNIQFRKCSPIVWSRLMLLIDLHVLDDDDDDDGRKRMTAWIEIWNGDVMMIVVMK